MCPVFENKTSRILIDSEGLRNMLFLILRMCALAKHRG